MNVAFFVYNRPAVTRQVWERIRAACPERLFVVADGPNPNKPTDAERTAEVRRIVREIDWPCEVARNESETNLGCKRRMASGISWVFEHVEEAILLEDDCLPDPSFFPFCVELLERYRDDARVMMISGDNFQGDWRPKESYYFSHHPHIWGWATWRRAWMLYDIEMKGWPEFRDRKMLKKLFGCWEAQEYYGSFLDNVYAGTIGDTWDVPWAWTCFRHGGLSIQPAVNLVQNIGFSDDSTHCAGVSPEERLRLAPPATSIDFPLRHSLRVKANHTADRCYFRYYLQMDGRLAMLAKTFIKLRPVARLLASLTYRFKRFSCWFFNPGMNNDERK